VIPAAEDNRAYRSGNLSGLISGSLYGDFDSSRNELQGIGGSVTGKLQYLLGVGHSEETFVLKLGETAGAGKTGALKFETEGAGEYSGGFIDFALSYTGAVNPLTGTFFFKPQAETGSLLLSPNRGSATAFTLWGYNYMHASAPYGSTENTVDWTTFLGALGYDDGTVVRASQDQTLGIALFVSNPDPSPEYAANPEPTTVFVWAVLSILGLGYCRRTR
jgi:hypothetical protein